MPALILEASLVAVVAGAFVLHVATAAMTVRRLRSPREPDGALLASRPSVSVIVPIVALGPGEVATALSAFGIGYSRFELLYCAFRADEPGLDALRRRIASAPDVNARLLIGRERRSANPKLDNMEKGWAAARSDYLAIVDSNVDVPSDLIERLLAVWDESTGLSCSIPIGVRPTGFWAHVECAFLNTFQARWQLAADSLGAGFGHGKAMLVRRDFLAARGGLQALHFDVAEDSAATKIVRAANLGVRLVQRPFEQPLGRREATAVWNRHLRWAQLRRRSFPQVFFLEAFGTVGAPLVAGLLLAACAGWPPLWAALMIAGSWYAVEAGLAVAVGWPWRPISFAACLVRDGMALAMWPVALVRASYSWRGQSVELADSSRLSAATGRRRQF
ncbi:ceramide glucosyltransferase [Roseiarcus fermentans]|uniref:Ceramide glucosyltransferase n=1 Tax=Roseiarcus fermentans TaxID=1473586 RepID=A0A366FRJ1_9HYPH|nr:glycosyltransferase [Roseiarcus fermentans]RBP17161.1 ceramide glucosyltransferase [Roseiarcus fermentans]